jgi:hypothetical protein
MFLLLVVLAADWLAVQLWAAAVVVLVDYLLAQYL